MGGCVVRISGWCLLFNSVVVYDSLLVVLAVCCDCLLWFDCVLLICWGFVYLYCKFVIVFVFAGWFVVAVLLDLLLDVCWFNSVVLCGSLLVWGVKFAVIAHCGFVAGPIDLWWF